MGLLKVQIMKYLHIVSESSFLTAPFTFKPCGILISSTKKSLKKAKLLNLENKSILDKAFLIHNSRTKVFSSQALFTKLSNKFFADTFFQTLKINQIFF